MTNVSLKNKKGKVFFIGAGPGAVDLITLRGRRLIDTAACVIFAGSLVNPELFEDLSMPLFDSSSMHLDEIISLMADTVRQGGHVARVHTGDPSLYGAIKEQMIRLDELEIDYEIVPGVSSAFGAAAALCAELTLPEVTQSVIITRRGGRTPVPEREQLTRLARHGATMMIFLSVSMIGEVVEDLREAGCSDDLPIVVVKRATWPDQQIIAGNLANIAEQVKVAGIGKTALICVGDAFGRRPIKAVSRLYDKEFSHEYRKND